MDRADLREALGRPTESTGATVDSLNVFPWTEYEVVMEKMDIDTKTSGLTPDEVAQRHESVQEPAGGWSRWHEPVAGRKSDVRRSHPTDTFERTCTGCLHQAEVG